MQTFLPFASIAFPAEATKYNPASWIDADELTLPAWVDVLSCGQEYGQFLSIRLPDGDGVWSLLHQDLFENGGADGDSEHFNSLEAAIAAGVKYATENGFTFVS